MADRISDDERRLIDEAIARGVMKVIPQGQSGLPIEPMSWREATNRTFAALKKTNDLKATPFKKSADSLSTEKRIRQMVNDGKTNAQIAKAMHMTVGAITQRLFRMGLTRANRKAGNNVPFGE